MKYTLTSIAAVTLGTFTALAGSPAIETIKNTLPEAPLTSGSLLNDMKDWAIQPTFNARARYEARNAQGLDASNAGTISLSPGLKTKSFNGFSALVEGEFTYSFIDDFQVGSPQSSRFNPYEAGNTPISDPESAELNQAYLAYSGNGFNAKVGRQRLKLDADQHVGNVGWRQNEQTLDAATLGYKTDAIDLTYSYVMQANRIFGSDARGGVKELVGNTHLLNAKFKVGDHKIGAYTYLMDWDDTQFNFASNNTYGAFTTLSTGPGKLYLESSFQTEADSSPSEYQAYYGHIKYSQPVAGGMGSIGLEYLGDQYVTPLSTVHAYNGFADAFIGQRLGLNNNWDGIADIYASYVKKGLPGGLVFKGFLHYFMDQGFNDAYGWEADAVVAKKLNDQATVVSKFAYFFADNDTQYTSDIAQASIQLDFKF